MINEECVQFETAKLLKKAGFPQDENKDFKVYYELPLRFENGCCNRSLLHGENAITYECPTQAQAMRWLREEKDIYVSIGRIRRGNVIDAGLGLSHKYYAAINDDYVNSSPICDTYEEAAETGIQAACEYLIVKQNKQ